jgi:hypothetical protein
MRSAGATRCVWGEPMLKFEDPNKGPRRLLAGDEQDLAKASVSSSIGSSLFCIRADAITEERAGPRFKRLGRVHRSISEFVTSTPLRLPRQRHFALAARVEILARRCDVTISLCEEISTQSTNPLWSGTSSRSAGVGSQDG